MEGGQSFPAGPIVGTIQRTEFNSEVRRLEEAIEHNNIRDKLQEARWQSEVRHVRELINQSEAAMSKALVIRTSEIERRLEALNHEYSRAAEERARVVSAATWNEFIKGFDEWRTGVNDFRSNWQGKVAIVTVLISAFVSVAVGLIISTMVGR